MVQQVTNGIKISVIANFEGITYRDYQQFFAFKYQVTIENMSNDTVQLLNRHWNIFDSLNNTEIIDGVGVIGEKPILHPGRAHTYQSNCFLISPIGSMNGYYNMVNFSNTHVFKVYIPTFQLMVPSISN